MGSNISELMANTKSPASKGCNTAEKRDMAETSPMRAPVAPLTLKLGHEDHGTDPLEKKVFDILRSFLEPNSLSSQSFEATVQALRELRPECAPDGVEIETLGNICRSRRADPVQPRVPGQVGGIAGAPESLGDLWLH